jgi:hypothetical protein
MLVLNLFDTLPVAVCLTLFLVFPLGLLMIVLIIIVIDIIVNHGKENASYTVPTMPPDRLMWEIHQFFLREGYECMFYLNMIKAEKGHELLMGVRTFIFTIETQEMGSILHGEFYLKGLIPRYMKFSQYGYLGIMPRRMGRKRKEDLFMRLGLSEMDRV